MTYMRILAGGLYFLLSTEWIAGVVAAGEHCENGIPVYGFEKLAGLKKSEGDSACVLLLSDGVQKKGIFVADADEIEAVEEGRIVPLPGEVRSEKNGYLYAAVYSDHVPSGLEYILAPEKLMELMEREEPDYYI